MFRDKLIAESIVSFSSGYNVEECILGQKYRFELNDWFDMEVLLPHGEIKDNYLEKMVAPKDYQGDAEVDWGVFLPASEDDFPAYHIESVYVRVWSHESVDLSAIRVRLDNPSHLIQHTLSKILMNIRVINPKCVMRINGRQFDGGGYSTDEILSVVTKWYYGRMERREC